jgi:hypothetical protein
VRKSDREIMEILEAFDVTGVAHSAASLCEADPDTVRRYAQARDLGRPVSVPAARPKLIDPFLEKIEEWVEWSAGKVRADVAHDRLAAMGFTGTERTRLVRFTASWPSSVSRPQPPLPQMTRT